MKYLFGLFICFFLFTFVNAQSCPLGLENDPVPGKCGLFTDKDQNDICDLSQNGLSDESDNIGGGCETKVGEVSGDELKKMTIKQLADRFDLDLQKLISLISKEVSLTVDQYTLLGKLHDENQFKMSKVKSMVEGMNNIEDNESDYSFDKRIYTIQKMHFGFFIVFVLLIVVLNILVTRFSVWTNRILNIVSYVLLPIFSLIWVIYVGYVKVDIMQAFSVGRQFGYIGLWLFFVIMFMKPICILFFKKMAICLPLRKQLGIAVFWLGFTHMLVYLLVWFKKDQPFFEFFNLFAFLFGLISIVALFVGFLTSNKYFMRLLGSNWKKIQMIAYPALLAATIHVYLINETRGIILFVVFGVYAVMKIIEWRKFQLS